MENTISTLFPALKEEKTIAPLTQDLLTVLSEFERREVISINDGRTDRTRQIADELCRRNNGNVRAIHRDRSMAMAMP